MALDEPKDTDVTFRLGGYDYIIDRDLLHSAQPLVIDYTSVGFRITSQAVCGPGASGCHQR
jgi:hypothetical protein